MARTRVLSKGILDGPLNRVHDRIVAEEFGHDEQDGQAILRPVGGGGSEASRIGWQRARAGVESQAMSLSRRGLFSAFLKPLQSHGKAVKEAATSPFTRTDKVAVIQGRRCLAYQQSYCSVCYERCPVPQALEFNEGLPRVVLEVCTGCGICRDVCPAPENAILMIDRRAGVGA